MHVREQIRNRVAAALSGATAAGDRVYSSRVYPMPGDNAPSIAVYTKSEEVVSSTLGAPVNTVRELELTIELFIKGASAVDSAIDELAVEVEMILGVSCDETLPVSWSSYDSFETEYSDSGNNITIVGLMVYTYTYSVNNDNPTTGV